jgi:glycosyltransferase involved in cell wall biosynthesis
MAAAIPLAIYAGSLIYFIADSSGRSIYVTAHPEVKFSVVIPSYNRATLLPRALDSILVQSLPACEIIVIDDGSSDETARVLRDNYPQVRYYYQRHSGVSSARNLGIRVSSEVWIALLDSDDCWHPDKLKCQARAIQENPGLRLVHTNELWIRNGVEVVQPPHLRKFGGSIFSNCLETCFIAASSTVIRRDIFADIGDFDESLKACEDYDMWLRVSANEHVGFLEQPLVTRFAGHAGQLSATKWLDSYRIRALSKLIASGVLTSSQRREADLTLQERTRIVARGVGKRRQHAG